MSSGKAEFSFEIELFQSQLKESSEFKERLVYLNKMLNGDNFFKVKIEMKEDHKITYIIASFINEGCDRLKINKDTKLAWKLIDALIADDCLFAIILKAELLLGNFDKMYLDEYFITHPELKNKKGKEIISLCNRIAKLGFPAISNYLNEQYVKSFAIFKNQNDASSLKKISFTRTMSVDNLNQRMKTEKDQKLINKLGYLNLRHSR